MLFLLLALTLNGSAYAKPAAAPQKSAEILFGDLRSLLPKMCVSQSTLRTCFSVNQPTCVSRVNGTFETCLRNQKIRYAGRSSFDAKTAWSIEQDLKSCVLKGYTALSMSSYRKSPACEAQVPKLKKPVAKAKSAGEDQPVVFEDPLEDQRDVVGRYTLRLLNDVRLVTNLKKDVESRKVCSKEKSESLGTCFKRALGDFEITSSVQITSLAVLATSLILRDREKGYNTKFSDLADLVLTVTEKVDTSRFHLAKIEPKTEVDRMALTTLRADDEKLLLMQVEKFTGILESKMNEELKGRNPAGLSSAKMRIQALKLTRWTYQK